MHSVVLALGFGIISASILGLSAVGFTLQFGISGVFNISYGAIMTTCAYCAYFIDITLHTNLWLGLAVGGVLGSVLAVACERLLFTPFARRGARLMTVVMVSLAIDLFVQNVIIMIAGSGFYTYRLPPERIINIAGMQFTSLQLALLAIGVAGMLGVHLLLRKTQLGKAMRATAADASLASGVGINVGRNTTITWALSGLFCGLGGVTLAINTAAFSSTTGDTFVFIVFAAAVVGGLGQPYGAMLGGLIIGIATELFAIYSPGLEYVMAFALLIVVLLVRPGGLVRIGGRPRKDTAPI